MLDNLPNELFLKVLELTIANDSWMELGKASEMFQATIGFVAKTIVDRVLEDAKKQNSTLYRYICKKLSYAPRETRGQNLSILKNIFFTAFSYGGQQPSFISSPEEIALMSARIDNTALEQAWPSIYDAICKANPTNTETPKGEINAASIRLFLQENPALLANVTVLDLKRLELRIIPPEVFLFTSLREIDLSSNYLACIPPEIQNLPNLTKLNLEKNLLETLPEEIGMLNALQELILSKNSLKELPASIGELNALQTLCIFENELEALPDSIGKLTQLQSLLIFKNKLQTLPTSIQGLVALENLDVSKNKLRELPSTLGELRALLELDITENQLTELPSAIGELSALQLLYASQNQLLSLPDTIGNLTALTYLWLNDNHLTELPASIGRLRELTSLDVHNNALTNLPATIGKIGHLRALDASKNQLSEFPSSLFELKELEVLTLSENKLTSLPSEFKKLSALTSLRVFNNPIVEIASEIAGLGKHSLTKLCQTCADTPDDVETIREQFDALFDDIAKQEVYSLIAEKSGQSVECAEEHLFDSIAMFKEAIYQASLKCFLETEEKQQIFLMVYRLGGNEKTDDPRAWGEEHAFENPERLLSAIDIVRNKTVIL